MAVKAKKAGRQVGIMTTVSVDHDTPSSFYAHTPSRSLYYEIGTFIPKSGFDFFAGSGRLSPNKKDDEKSHNLFDFINSAGYEVSPGMKEYSEISDNAG